MQMGTGTGTATQAQPHRHTGTSTQAQAQAQAQAEAQAQSHTSGKWFGTKEATLSTCVIPAACRLTKLAAAASEPTYSRGST
jgi:hypothetical protein